jgi:hypothetical protein
VRVSFNYFISQTVFRYIVDAVHLVATHGWSLLPQYRFDPYTGLWKHRDGVVEPPLRLSELHYTESGELAWPSRHERAPESDLAGYLRYARELCEALPAAPEPDGVVSANFEALRWFDLPAVSLLA